MEEARETLIKRFEQMIDLPAFLGQRGFTPATAQPGQPGLVMTARDDRVIVVLRQDVERSGCWTYAPSDRPDDRGTVTDYLQRHDGLNRDACLERLIALVGGRRSRCADVLRYRAFVFAKPVPLLRAQKAYRDAVERFREATRALEQLGIQRSLLDEWRFGALATENEVMRMLIEPQDLWISRYRAADNRLVLAERPIDAISLEQTRRDRRTCYLALGRNPSQPLRARIAHLLAELPKGMSVVLAFGRDQAGRRLADEVQQLEPRIRMERLTPAFGACWNDQVRLEARHARSLPRTMSTTAQPRPSI